jgi:hypothetical protein
VGPGGGGFGGGWGGGVSAVGGGAGGGGGGGGGDVAVGAVAAPRGGGRAGGGLWRRCRAVGVASSWWAARWGGTRCCCRRRRRPTCWSATPHWALPSRGGGPGGGAVALRGARMRDRVPPNELGWARVETEPWPTDAPVETGLRAVVHRERRGVGRPGGARSVRGGRAARQAAGESARLRALLAAPATADATVCCWGTTSGSNPSR